MMIVNLVSPDRPLRQTSSSATTPRSRSRTNWAGCPASPTSTYLGERDYSMRAWLDPEKLASVGLTADDVVAAISEQNLQVAAGQIGQQPVPRGQQFQLTINTLGRLIDPEQFGDIIIKVGQSRPAARRPGGKRRHNAHAGVSRPASSACATSPASSSARSNTTSPARSTASRRWRCRSISCPAPTPWRPPSGVYAKMEELKQRFPDGLDTRSSTTRRRSSTNRSSRSSRRCATRSSWWRSSCWSSCKTGGRR